MEASGILAMSMTQTSRMVLWRQLFLNQKLHIGVILRGVQSVRYDKTTPHSFEARMAAYSLSTQLLLPRAQSRGVVQAGQKPLIICGGWCLDEQDDRDVVLSTCLG